MKVETGVATGHPIVIACKEFIGVIRTWRYAKKHGLPYRKWYGVYEKGTENVVARMGCLPGAKQRAFDLANIMNEQEEDSYA